MQASTLEFVYTRNDLRHVSANHVAVFRNVKYRGLIPR